MQPMLVGGAISIDSEHVASMFEDSPPLAVYSRQQQLIPQVWQRTADDSGVITKQKPANSAEQGEYPHRPGCALRPGFQRRTLNDL